jgi:deoxyribodipyrimidine photo-lyase
MKMISRRCSELLDTMVDAGMRQLNETGYMHNRVRGGRVFLCKHLLINWQWEKLILLKSYWIMKCHLMWVVAMGNGTGCDATPYFRVFNPSIQLKKLMKGVYIRQWIPEFELMESHRSCFCKRKSYCNV